jgi:hypothetical protein
MKDKMITVVIVEAEKSPLAIAALVRRKCVPVLPIATGGCWGWMGKAGIRATANGGREEVRGLLPDFHLVEWQDRRVIILFDANVRVNWKVRQARRALAEALERLGATVLACNTPAAEGVNGPDDYIALFGDDAALQLLQEAKPLSASWKDDPIRSKKDGTPTAVVANAITALRESPEWFGILSHDEFSRNVVTKGPTSFGKPAGETWTNNDDTATAEWLEHHGILVKTHIAAEAIQNVTAGNSFHPVRNYLQSLMWDGTERLPTWLKRYLGVADCDETRTYTKGVGLRWLVSAVARIFAR